MFVSGSESLGNSVPVYCSGLTSFDVCSWKISLKNFQGLLSIVQLSMFFFVVAVSCDSFYIISKCFMFVNNFFNLFFVLHLKHLFLVHQLIYNNIPFSGCQALFSTFFTFSWSAFYIQAHVYCRSMLLSFKQNGERGIRTLAPLLTTYSLSRGAPSASLGISPKRPLSNIHDSFLFVQYFFLIFHWYFKIGTWLWNTASFVLGSLFHSSCQAVKRIFFFQYIILSESFFTISQRIRKNVPRHILAPSALLSASDAR